MKILFTLLILLLSIPVSAQQDPLYAQYMLNPLLINPAYTGLSNNLTVIVGYRTQWAGLEGQPQTFNASGHTSLVDNKVGLGLLISTDKIGNITNTASNVTAAYKLNLGQSTFSFGMQAGLQQYTIDFAGLKVRDPNDDAFAGNESETRLNIGAGAIFKNERVLLGFSIPRMLPTTFENGGQEFDLYDQHYYLMGAYVAYLNDHVRLKPTALLRGVKGAPASIDVAFNVNLNTIHTAGVFTRNFSTYGILLKTLLKETIKLGYTFELPTNKSVGVNFPTHEISLGLQLSVFSFHNDMISNF